MPCLTSFSHIRPCHEIDQEELLDKIAEAHALAEGNKELSPTFRKTLTQLKVGKEQISKRGIQISDFFHSDFASGEIYPIATIPDGKGWTERSTFFDREVSAIFEQFYSQDTPLPPHLIHVTCTGYVSPSPAQKLISSKGGWKTTGVTHAYHMGCYASFPAIRIGIGFLSPSCPQVDIVHTEICSLHMHPRIHSKEQLIVQSLFGDGFVKYSLVPSSPFPNFQLLAIHEEMIPDSTQCMTWSCGEQGMRMTLSNQVPFLITKSLEGYLNRLCERAGVSFNALKESAIFAIHPGGPKILQQIAEQLNLSSFQVNHSIETLRLFGNMSSGTLPHTWEKILYDPLIPFQTMVLSLAFGPGLNIAGAIFLKKKGEGT